MGRCPAEGLRSLRQAEGRPPQSKVEPLKASDPNGVVLFFWCEAREGFPQPGQRRFPRTHSDPAPGTARSAGALGREQREQPGSHKRGLAGA